MTNHTHNRPAIVVPDKISICQPQSTVLPNGVPLHILNCSDQDVARVSFVFHAGTSFQTTPFSASSAANLLAEGTSKFTAQQIAEQLDFYGSFYEVSLDRDYAVITFVSLLKFFPQTLETAREILLSPAFDKKEIEIYCNKRKQRLAVERSKAAFHAREIFSQAIFGNDHPYGVSYPESLYDELTRRQLFEFYNKHYTAENCFVVCSGKLDASAQAMIAALAGDIPRGNADSAAGFPKAHSIRSRYKKYDGAVQSAVRIGKLLFPRTHPDFVPMQVVTTILGGYFGSRLVHNLREEHGYTYGVYAAMANLEHEGYMAVATEVATEATEDAVRQIFVEMDRMCTDLVDEHELEMVKNIMTGEVMRVLDGPFGIADVTIENIQNGNDNDYLDRFLETVKSTTPEQVREMAGRYFDPETFTTVIVGEDPSGGSFELDR